MRIIDVTSSEAVKIKGFPAFAQVATQEVVSLGPDEVGIIQGKHGFHEQGVGIFGGIVNPRWKDKLTIEFMIFGELNLKKGDKIAHVIVLRDAPA